MLKLPQYILETLSIIKNVNEIPDIEVFLGDNLNFTIRVFPWDLANDDNISTNNILPNLTNSKINLNNTISNMWGQSNKKVLQSTKRMSFHSSKAC